MGSKIRVFVFSDDAISQAGMQTQLRGQPDVAVCDETMIDDAEVAVVIVDSVDDAACRTIRAIQRNGCPRVVLVVGTLDDTSLMVAVELGVAVKPPRSGCALRSSLPPAATARWPLICSDA